MHKVGNVGIIVLPKFKHKLDIVFSHIDVISLHSDGFQFVLKLFHLVTRSVLFSLEAAQKSQCCQLCVLRENSSSMFLFRMKWFPAPYFDFRNL